MADVQKRNFRTIMILLALFMTIGSTNAFAQVEIEGDLPATSELIISSATSTTSTTLALVEIFVCSGIRMTCDVLSSTSQISSITLQSAGRRASLFVNINAVALQQGVSIGGGDIVNDFARVLTLPASHDNAFASLLRRERKVLMAFLNQPKIDANATSIMMEILYTAMKNDPAFKNIVI